MFVKMVRDKIGGILDIDVVPANSKPGKAAMLLLKLHEECAELGKDLTCAEEYGDILEVLQELAKVAGVPWDLIELAQKEKFDEKGGFTRGNVMRKGIT